MGCRDQPVEGKTGKEQFDLLRDVLFSVQFSFNAASHDHGEKK